MCTKYLVGVALLAATVSCAPQDSSELTKEELKLLGVPGTIPVEIATRCGLFFAKDEIGLPPIETLFVIKQTWEAPECPTTDRVERAVQFCDNLWKKIGPKLVYTNPSLLKKRKEEGFTMGDDICQNLLEKGVRFAGQKSKRFPEGILIGFFSNTCGNTEWHDTGARHAQPICCAKGRHVDCP